MRPQGKLAMHMTHLNLALVTSWDHTGPSRGALRDLRIVWPQAKPMDKAEVR
jgi:hypothetical protein